MFTNITTPELRRMAESTQAAARRAATPTELAGYQDQLEEILVELALRKEEARQRTIRRLAAELLER